jgi:hypothetical protein
LVKRLEEIDAKVAAPPKIFVSVLKGVRVVSRAIVPNTVNIVCGIPLISKLINFRKSNIPVVYKRSFRKQ